ncbi:zinc finger protein 792-like [Pollicipes pollicipes]|uniref:zinc finger protein 792-like n=1 Tax=Pollicipes pollicipes TaxID=41117 RepID=UPI0018855538|nr:zinc finger protein 792-like [Pollicipes pollicipes]
MGKAYESWIHSAFACDVCGRFYAHAVSLGLHKKVHEGLTTCALCGKVLNKVADLRAHLRQVHRLSKDDVKKIVPHRPLFCDVCGRKYFHVSSLALHKKVHEGLTTCVICGKVSSKVANLRRHLENSHKLSQEEIRTVRSLRRHLRDVHRLPADEVRRNTELDAPAGPAPL